MYTEFLSGRLVFVCFLCWLWLSCYSSRLDSSYPTCMLRYANQPSEQTMDLKKPIIHGWVLPKNQGKWKRGTFFKMRKFYIHTSLLFICQYQFGKFVKLFKLKMHLLNVFLWLWRHITWPHVHLTVSSSIIKVSHIWHRWAQRGIPSQERTCTQSGMNTWEGWDYTLCGHCTIYHMIRET